jgi:hypothetical protein
MQTWRVVQGQASTITIKVSACSLSATEILAATVSDGHTGPPTLSLTPAWGASGPPYVALTLTSGQSAALPVGGYVVQVTLASNNGALAYCLLEVVAAPNGTPTYDLLATPAQAMMMNAEIAASPDKVAALPFALSKATETIRRYCNRTFTRREYTDYYTPSLEGEVMLAETPVHRIVRVSRRLQTAIEITADASVYQVAYADFITQDDAAAGPFNVRYTGLTLNGVASGVASTAPVLFSGLATLNDLAAAVNAVPGWKATVQDSYGAWPVSELYCDGTSQGALTDGVQIQVFSDDVSLSRLDRRTGLLVIPNATFGGGFGPRWGPDWLAWGDFGQIRDDVVRVVYDAGFTVIPSVVQTAAVELAKTVFDRINLDYAIKKESIGSYSYELNDSISMSIPDPIRQDLSPFVIHRA